MFAAVVTVVIDAGKESEARQVLTEQIVPMVKASPGFVAGYWMDPVGSKGWSVAIFDTEEQARAVAPEAGMRPPGAPVTVENVEFREVVASA